MTNKKIIFSKRKFLAATLAAMMAMSITVTASADVVETTTDNSDQTEVQTEPTNVLPVYSPEFPDAYILPNETMGMSISDSTIQTVSATVFVEEEYGFDNSGNPITISSRLLPESEVLEIGLENFMDMEDARHDAVSKLMQTRAAVNARGSLSISFSGGGTISGNDITYDLNASASWSPSGLFWLSDRENNPASGSDYIGVTWSGGYTTPHSAQINTTTWTTISNSHFNPPLPPVLCDAVPNAGRVWEFYEYWEIPIGGGRTQNNYYKNISIDITLAKNNIGDEAAETVMKYVHTYTSTKGTVSITANSSGVGGGFTVTGVDKQWSVVCTLTGLMC